MDHEFRRHTAPSGDHGFAGGKRTDFLYDAAALGQDGWTSSIMNGAVDAASAEQGRVGGVDDGLGGFFRDVGRAVEFDGLLIREGQAGCEVRHGG
jgi:hypothetical protein